MPEPSAGPPRRNLGAWLTEQPVIVAVGALAALVTALLAVLDALDSRNGRVAVLLAATLVAVLVLWEGRRRSGPRGRRVLTAMMLVTVLAAGAGAGRLMIRDQPDQTAGQPAAFSLEDVRLATWRDEGAELGLAFRGGAASAYIVRLDVLQIATMPECGGEGSVDWITVDAAAGVIAGSEGDTLLVARQRSSDSPGSSVEVQAEQVASRCRSSSRLTLRPQQAMAAEDLGQLRVRLPATYRISTVEYENQSSGDRRPADEVLADADISLPDGERQYLERLLDSGEHRLFLWPWSTAFDRSLFQGWDFVLLVAASLSDGSCAVGGLDLLDENALLDPPSAGDLFGTPNDGAAPGSCA